MAAGLVAVAAGIVALLGLTGQITTPRTWMRTVMAGLPVVAVSGVYFAAEGWNLAIALGMTLSVILGMLASMIGPAELPVPSGHRVSQVWRFLAVSVVGVVLGSMVIRWGAGLLAPIPLLSPQDVALVITVAAVIAAAGGSALRGIVSTGTIILLVLLVLVLVAGVVGGAPSTLTEPLVPVSHAATAWLLLVVGFVLAASNPALRQIRAEGGSVVPGTIILGVITVAALLALLSFNGGYLKLPSFSMGIVAGYLGFSSPVPGAVVCTLIALVVIASGIVQFRSVFHAVGEFVDSPAVPAGWWSATWFRGVLVGIVAVLLAMRFIPLEPILWVTALVAVSGWIVGLRSERGSASTGDSSDTPQEIDPMAVGQGPSQ